MVIVEFKLGKTLAGKYITSFTYVNSDGTECMADQSTLTELDSEEIVYCCIVVCDFSFNFQSLVF